jgi:hypothetical protein
MPSPWCGWCRDSDKSTARSPRSVRCGVMFDWRSLRGVTVAVATLGVVLGIFVALIYVDRGPIVHGLAAIGFI